MYLIFVANSPSPNTIELYNALQERSDVKLEVVYLAKKNVKWKESNFPIKYKTVTGLNFSPFPRRVNTAFCPGLLFRILFFKRDAKIIIQGYSNPTNFLLIVSLALFRPKGSWAFWGERIKESDTKSPLKNFVKKLVVFFISKSGRVYGVGQAGADNYVTQGVPRKLAKSLPYTKDFSIYSSTSKRYENQRLVVTSRLVASKKIDLLLKVFIELAAEFPDWSLSIIGDGPMRHVLERDVPAVFRKQICFHGYGNAGIQAEVYQKSDIFVLPSAHDGWGMVVPEAMAAGLPVVTTDGVISGRDLIENEKNGFLIPVEDAEALKSVLSNVMRGSYDLEAMGKIALQVVSEYSPDKISNALVVDISSGWCADF